MKASELLNKEVWVEDLKLGTVKDVVLDAEEWKVTHLGVKLTKDAAKEVLGAKKSCMNVLAISAIGPASKSCTSTTKIDAQVTKGQLHLYLRPA